MAPTQGHGSEFAPFPGDTDGPADSLTRLAESDKVTVLLTTHYLDEADRLAGRLAIVDHGRVVAEGEPDRLKRDLDVSSLDEVYLHYAGRRYSDATRLTEVAGR